MPNGLGEFPELKVGDPSSTAYFLGHLATVVTHIYNNQQTVMKWMGIQQHGEAVNEGVRKTKHQYFGWLNDIPKYIPQAVGGLLLLLAGYVLRLLS